MEVGGGLGQKSRGLTWADHLAAKWKLARTGVRVEAAAESGGCAEAVAASPHMVTSLSALILGLP